MAQKVFDAVTADQTNATGIAWDKNSRFGYLVGAGTFGNGTLSIEVSPDDGTTWVPGGTETELTAPGIKLFEAPTGKGMQVRPRFEGSTGATLTAWIARARAGSG